MHYLVQDVIFISLVLIGFLALFQGTQRLLKRLTRQPRNRPSSMKLAVRDIKLPP